MNRIIALLLALVVGCASQGSMTPTLESSMRYRTPTSGGANNTSTSYQPAYPAGMQQSAAYIMYPGANGTQWSGTGSDPYLATLIYASYVNRTMAAVPAGATVMMPGTVGSTQMGAPTVNASGPVIADGLSPAAVRTYIQPLVDDARRTRAMIRRH